jgi:hypothetical protein
MKRLPILVCAIVVALSVADAARAQMQPPGWSQFNPPPPAPPPSSQIEVPAVPQMDAPLRQTYRRAPLPSFSDRIGNCLDQGAAAGLGPNERAAYSRACVNR